MGYKRVKSDTFLLMAFDIAGYSKKRRAEHEMLTKVQTVYKTWGKHRATWCKNRGRSTASWYELPVGDELIIAANDDAEVAICFLSFITQWNNLIKEARKKKEEEIHLRFALHRGDAIEVGIRGLLNLKEQKKTDNLIGDSINMLARLLNIARPTQVLASEEFWNRISGFFSKKKTLPSEVGITDPNGCRFDLYHVRVKHGEELDVYNLLWDSAAGFVGHPAPPDAPLGALFMWENNYHRDRAFGTFLRTSEQQLYEFYGPRLEADKIVSIIEGEYFWRLPYTIEYQHPDIDASLTTIEELSPEGYQGRFTDKNIVDNLKLYVTKYEENDLAAVSIIEWNEDKLRQPRRLQLRKVQYSDVVSTDLAADLSEKQRDTWMPLRKSKFDFTGTRLWELGTHRFIPDALGTTTEVVTSDGTLLHPWRSSLVHSHPSTYTAGASGAVDWKDVDDEVLERSDKEGYRLKVRYKKHIKRPLFPLEWPAIRELNDELSIEPEEIQNVYFLGIARELLRVGKPNFFFVAYLKVNKENLEDRMPIAREYWELGKERKPLKLQLKQNQEQNRRRVLEEAIKGDEYNPVTRMAMYLLANCKGALDLNKV